MTIHAWFGIAAGVVQALSLLPYLRAIVRGTTRPNAVSFGVWTVLSVIDVVAMYAGAGRGWPLVLPLVGTAGMTIITIFALSGYGYSASSRLDMACLVIGLIGIALWQMTGEPALALALSIVASLAAAIPTIVKTYRAPHTEYAPAWLMVAAASVLSILSVTTYDFTNLAYAGYMFLETATIGILALRTRKHLYA
jgi:hypothetical protein